MGWVKFLATVAVLFTFCDKAATVECYYRIFGIFDSQLICPSSGDKITDIFCCGPVYKRYCCGTIETLQRTIFEDHNDTDDIWKFAVIGSVAIILLVITCICCCCCCPCCLLAKRRRAINYPPQTVIIASNPGSYPVCPPPQQFQSNYSMTDDRGNPPPYPGLQNSSPYNPTFK